MKEISITVDEEGESEIDLKNFHGQGCERVLADFAGGDKTKTIRNKPEYLEVVRQKEDQKA
jgi:hypothetical protein